MVAFLEKSIFFKLLFFDLDWINLIDNEVVKTFGDDFKKVSIPGVTLDAEHEYRTLRCHISYMTQTTAQPSLPNYHKKLKSLKICILG